MIHTFKAKIKIAVVLAFINIEAAYDHVDSFDADDGIFLCLLRSPCCLLYLWLVSYVFHALNLNHATSNLYQLSRLLPGHMYQSLLCDFFDWIVENLDNE
jgi:hypothetical protein